MKEKGVVMLCISASQICKRFFSFFCTCGMDKSRSIIKRGSVSRKHELGSFGEPCPTEICGDTKCLDVHLTETGVRHTGVQH